MVITHVMFTCNFCDNKFFHFSVYTFFMFRFKYGTLQARNVSVQLPKAIIDLPMASLLVNMFLFKLILPIPIDDNSQWLFPFYCKNIFTVFFLNLFSVYDITKRSSFLSIQRWIEEVRRYTASNVLLILIGNKCDLESAREVSDYQSKSNNNK